MGHGPRTNQLDFGGNLVQDLDPVFLSLNQDPDTEIFYCPAWLISISVFIGQLVLQVAWHC